MNALFIQRMSDYIHTPQRLKSAGIIIDTKITRSNTLLTHFHKKPYPATAQRIVLKNINQLLLLEGRVAKYYWRQYGTLLPSWVTFPGRHAQSDDVTNKLLDIGYHHLAINVRKILDEKDCTTALGLLHVAQNSDATPLVYDLMELFRADIVDMSVVTWLRQKKQPITKLTKKHITYVLHGINERMDKHFYLANFQQCHTYRYYMEVQITKFIKAINHREMFKPMKLPSRHDTRCTCKSTHDVI